jgi:hypothetical protein
MIIIEIGRVKILGESHGLSRWLWLSATLSWAKALVGPSPKAWLGPASGFELGRAHH